MSHVACDNACLALRDLHQSGLWDALSAHQSELAALEPDAGSDAPSAAVFDALFDALSLPLHPLENRDARA